MRAEITQIMNVAGLKIFSYEKGGRFYAWCKLGRFVGPWHRVYNTAQDRMVGILAFATKHGAKDLKQFAVSA